MSDSGPRGRVRLDVAAATGLLSVDGERRRPVVCSFPWSGCACDCQAFAGDCPPCLARLRPPRGADATCWGTRGTLMDWVPVHLLSALPPPKALISHFLVSSRTPHGADDPRGLAAVALPRAPLSSRAAAGGSDGPTSPAAAFSFGRSARRRRSAALPHPRHAEQRANACRGRAPSLGSPKPTDRETRGPRCPNSRRGDLRDFLPLPWVSFLARTIWPFLPKYTYYRATSAHNVAPPLGQSPRAKTRFRPAGRSAGRCAPPCAPGLVCFQRDSRGAGARPGLTQATSHCADKLSAHPARLPRPSTPTGDCAPGMKKLLNRDGHPCPGGSSFRHAPIP